MRTCIYGIILLGQLFLTTQWAYGTPVTLTLNDAIRAAMDHSLDLKIGEAEIHLKMAEQLETASAYYPTLSLRWDSEYTEDLDENSGVVAIGDTVSTDGSAYEQSLSTTIGFLAWDFGARALRYASAERRVVAARFERAITFQSLVLEVIDAYVRAYELNQQIELLTKKIALRKQLFEQLERLCIAGTVGQSEVHAAALSLASDVTQLDRIENDYAKALLSLTELTGKKYFLAHTVLSPLPVIDTDAEIVDLQQHPKLKAFSATIDALNLEKQAHQKSYYPRVNLYGRYRLYGANVSSYMESVYDVSQLDASVGISVQWDLFNGFRDTARTRQLEARLRQLALQQEKARQELQREADSLLVEMKNLRSKQAHLQNRQRQLDTASKAQQRLLKTGVIDPIEVAQHKLQQLDQTFEINQELLKRHVAALKMKVWQGEGLP